MRIAVISFGKAICYPPLMDTKEWLSPKKFAKYRGVSYERIIQLLAMGAIPDHKKLENGRSLIPKDATVLLTGKGTQKITGPVRYVGSDPEGERVPRWKRD